MDPQHAFELAAGGHSMKGKQCHLIPNKSGALCKTI